MKRREMLRALGALTLASVSTEGMARDNGSNTQRKPVGNEPALGDAHFLSATNPVATVDQRDLEVLAIRIARTPELQKAKANAAARLKLLAGHDVPTEAWSSFDAVMDEWAFQNALKAANSDPNYPKVLGYVFEPAHEWFGIKIPGGVGFGGINPDNNYSIIPVDGRARFELHGRRIEPGPTDVQFTLLGNFFLTITLANLDWNDLQVKPDGGFVITIGPEPANGRSNHLQTGPDARYLLIRDVRGDWRQVANAYRVKRMDRVRAPPITFEQMVDRAARFTIDDVAGAYLFMAMNSAQEINTIKPPFGSGNLGGLVTQMMTGARLKLSDDEAFVVTVGPGASKYHVLPLYNFWQCTMDIGDHTSCMNSVQSQANADGSFTYVIALQDPGVYNWLDSVGLHEPRFWIRWQLLSPNPGPEARPWIKGELVKLRDLDQVLPSAMKRITPAERRKQLAERLESFKLRYVDS